MPAAAPPAPASPSSTAAPPPAAGSGARGTVSALAGWLRRDARFDVPASLVVFLVAVPLSLGIAVASDAPVSAGLVAAAVGGIVAGLVGGAPLQVSGPAAGLTVVVAETVAQYGWPATVAITFAAGLLQILLGATRLGRFALAISPTVVTAMLAGIGISIVLGQLNVALGGSSRSSAWENVQSLPASFAGLEPHALVAAALVIAVLLAWPRLPAAIRRIPGQLVAVVLVTVVAALWLPDAARVDLGGGLFSGLGVLELPDGGPLDLGGAVLTVALIASVESLLCAVAVDKLHGGPRSRLDRELVGQGLANSASGLLGGLPVTGVIVRSSANVAAGARRRASAVLHGVWVLVFALLLVSVVEQIPLAVLAGLLIVMGASLVRRRDLKSARARGELWIYLLTVGFVLGLNLVEGVVIGLAAALVLVLVRMLRLEVDVREAGLTPDGRRHWLVEVTGSLSFLATPVLVRKLSAIPEGEVVEVDLLVDYLDPAGQDQLEDWRNRYEAAGGSVVLDTPGAGPIPDGAKAAKATPLTPRAVLPWSAWQGPGRELGTGDGPAHHPLALGVREYHRRTASALQPVYEELRDGQQPEAAFVTCVDSRVVPNVLTSSGPGDLFTVRTMGNLVPTGADDDGSVSAPVLYAVDQLDVTTVVVCGHSGCGAMTAALSEPAEGPVGRWMQHAKPSLQAWRAGHPVGRAAAEQGLGEVDQLGQVNVALALEHLAEVLVERAARVQLVGLFLDIADGTVSVLQGDRFVPLTDGELVELAHLREPDPVA